MEQKFKVLEVSEGCYAVIDVSNHKEYCVCNALENDVGSAEKRALDIADALNKKHSNC